MKKRFKLYLETSFWKRLVDDGPTPRREISYAFFRDVIGKHRVMVGKKVFEEITHTTPPAQRNALFRRMDACRAKTIPATAQIHDLAEQLLVAGGWGEGRRADMVHLACAMITGADALVTWDKSDLANDETRRIFKAVAKERRLTLPHVGTPMEVKSCLGIA
ncbi:MAG: hypothetical protein FD180_75 [Planctomycetota bacterium]|nr:MAG: hypothetical protein FD180_75 [Planctomycetota bacterium]